MEDWIWIPVLWFITWVKRGQSHDLYEFGSRSVKQRRQHLFHSVAVNIKSIKRSICKIIVQSQTHTTSSINIHSPPPFFKRQSMKGFWSPNRNSPTTLRHQRLHGLWVSEDFDERESIRKAYTFMLPTLLVPKLPQTSWCSHFQGVENLHKKH